MTTLQSPVVTLSYPHLWKPTPKAEGSAELVFSAVGLLNKQQMKSPAWKALLDAISEAWIKAAFPKLILGKSVKSPIRLCAEKENFPQEYEVFFNCWSKSRPGVVDTAKNYITDSNEVWAGQYVRFSLNPFSWEHSGKKGVSLGLNHVHDHQVVEGLESCLDGRKPEVPKESFDDEFPDDANADEDIDV